MKKEKIRLLILIFIAIAILGFIAQYRFKKLGKALPKDSLSSITLPEIKSEIPSQKGADQEFITSDGQLKIKFPGDWIVGNEELLKALNQGGVDLPDSEILLFAVKVDFFTSLPCYLILQTIEKKSLDETMKIIEKRLKDKAGEIVQLEKRVGEAIFEGKYQVRLGNNTYFLRLKGKLIFRPQKNYLFWIFVPEENWLKMLSEIDSILESVSLIE